MSLDKLEKNTARWTIKCEDAASDIYLGALTDMLYEEVKGVRVARLTRETLSVSFDVASAEDAKKAALIAQHASLLHGMKGEVIYRDVPSIDA